MTECRCGARWTGYRIEHCTVCHATFTGTEAGDMHMVGDQAVFTGPDRLRCLTMEEMGAKGMSFHINNTGTAVWSRGSANRKSKEPRQHPFSLGVSFSDGPGGVPQGDCLAGETESLDETLVTR